MKNLLKFILGISILASCKPSTNKNKTENAALQQEVQAYLDAYNQKYKELSTASNKAQWRSNIMIVEGDSTNAIATRKASEDYARFTGSAENISKARQYLEQKSSLTDLQVKQLNRVLYFAANNPATVETVVKERIKAETEQTEKLFGFSFKIDNKPVTTNDIDAVLNTESNLQKRIKAWEASKEVGKTLKDGLVKLRDLRNNTVKPLGYSDYFNYQVSDYGMSTKEMMDLLDKINKEVFPLYRELHTYARYELAKKYNEKNVPDMLPAHWLPNRWGQDWSSMIHLEGLNLDSVLRSKNAEWIIRQGERFYISLGFPPLPKTFYERSSLYPYDAKEKVKKNNHASAWHIDLENDLRCLMSVVPNAEWYETSHHELGHIYYYVSYSNPEVPYVLREGANRAFHEGLGSMIGLAAMQKPFLAHLELLPKDSKTDEIRTLLKEALNYIVFIPWSAGTMSHFEHDLYASNLPADQFNQRWWELAAKYQGIVPPAARGEMYCDAATKTHINDDAAQYYDYALSYVLLFQLHDHIARNILKQDPHATNYYGSKETGTFIAEIMKPGSSRDWRELLKEKIGQDLSAQPMLHYFEPLMEYLKKENQGRKYTLELP